MLSASTTIERTTHGHFSRGTARWPQFELYRIPSLGNSGRSRERFWTNLLGIAFIARNSPTCNSVYGVLRFYSCLLHRCVEGWVGLGPDTLGLSFGVYAFPGRSL